MLPCFLGIFSSRLVKSGSKQRIKILRVSLGLIIKSTCPNSAAEKTVEIFQYQQFYQLQI